MSEYFYSFEMILRSFYYFAPAAWWGSMFKKLEDIANEENQ